MKHIDVAWQAANSSDPLRLVSELDERGFETRKLEFFQSGAVGSASATHSTEGTVLGTEAVPSLKEINSDPQFHGTEISSEQFELLWSQYGRSIQEYEVVEFLAPANDVPARLVATKATVLLTCEHLPRWAYEVEFVVSDGSTLWTGSLTRELLRAPAR
jgi:hypothetical protein